MPNFGRLREVTKEELLQPNLDRAAWRDLLYKSKVLVLKGLHGLSRDELWQIHTVFGMPWAAETYKLSFEAAVCDTPGQYVTEYSNVGSRGRIGDKMLPWHHDIPWHRAYKYPIRSLYPTMLDGGKGVTTDFCDASAIWSRTDQSNWDKIAKADIRLQYWYDAARGVTNTDSRIVPLCERHPHTNKWNLMLNSFGPRRDDLPFSTASTGAWIIDCWSKSEHVGLEFIDWLHSLVVTEDNIYRHEWELGDLVLFDNHSGIMHGRQGIREPNVTRAFWRMNLHHYWESLYAG